jgi:hypothetical protein
LPRTTTTLFLNFQKFFTSYREQKNFIVNILLYLILGGQFFQFYSFKNNFLKETANEFASIFTLFYHIKGFEDQNQLESLVIFSNISSFFICLDSYVIPVITLLEAFKLKLAIIKPYK